MSVTAFAKDPGGYLFEVIERPHTPKLLCQVMLRVGDLDRCIKFYEKALGMKFYRKIDRQKQKYTLPMMGSAEEKEMILLELTYNYGVTEYTKGNAYAQVAINTTDVYKRAEVLNHVIQELGGKINRRYGPLLGLGTKITYFLDPDGWKNSKLNLSDCRFWSIMKTLRKSGTIVFEISVAKSTGAGFQSAAPKVNLTREHKIESQLLTVADKFTFINV